MIPKFFAPPHFENPEDNFRAKFINGFAWSLIILLVIGIIPFLLQDTFNFTIVVLAVLVGIMGLSLLLLHKGYLHQSGLLLIALSWLGITLQAYTADGVKDVIVVGYIAISLLASIVLDWRSGSVVLVASVGALWALYLLEANGWIAPVLQETFGYTRDLTIVFVAIATLIYFSTTSLREAVQRANKSEAALLASNKNLQDLNLTLEERVASRTIELQSANQRNERRAKQFEGIAEVSRVTASNQNLDVLLPLIVNVISEQFGFYHTGIFLMEENREYAVLAAASSIGGKRMLQRGHKLRAGQTGIVGVVAATGTPRIALDVETDAVFFNNPDLPNTRSEIALPLRASHDVIGVLDVQSTEERAFQPEDVEVLSTLADQVTVAIQNARSYETTRELLRQAERTSGAYLRDSWKALQVQSKHVGYMASGTSLKALDKPMTSPQIEQAIACKETVAQGGKKPVLAVPIQLRDQIVGVMDIQMPNEHHWDADEVDIVKAVADRLSLAVETSMLIESTQRRAEIERITSEISGKIGSTSEFEAILRTTAEELSRALGGSEVCVQLQPEALEAQIQAEKGYTEE